MTRLQACAAVALLGFAATPVRAQHGHVPTGDTLRRLSVGAMAVGLYSYAAPGPFKQRISEAYLTQPMAFVTTRALGGRVLSYVTVNAEGATLDRGEINPGVYGEGYVDRRHPHTWVHEAMLGVRGTTSRVRWSVFGGKGFAPYGTDDPMIRPFVKYPVNHHHAQLLERAMLTASLGWQALTLEGAAFNGDEPESPTDWPNTDRFGDSWSARASYRPGSAWEFSASAAAVTSPEFAAGFGLDQRKRAASARFSQADGRVRYALLEYARTEEYSNSRLAFDFDSWLAEGSVQAGRFTVSTRVERTTRPEEERTTSFFRTIRPLLDFNILGRTRWTNVTMNASHLGRGWRTVTGRPFVEIGYHVPRATRRPTPLDPVELYGGRHVWTASAGIRLHAGSMRNRFGRYDITP